MLTLKYIRFDTGAEIISECHAVKADVCDDGSRRVAAYESEKMQDGPVGYFFGEGPVKRDGRRLYENTAILYVMNRFGATVATYHFEKSNVSVEQPEAVE